MKRVSMEHTGDRVDHVVDLDDLPALTDAERADLAGLRSLSDDDIDRSDVPGLTVDPWRQAVRNPVLRRGKTETAVRLDGDVLAWFRAQGEGYEARINAVLRRATMEAAAPDRG